MACRTSAEVCSTGSTSTHKTIDLHLAFCSGLSSYRNHRGQATCIESPFSNVPTHRKPITRRSIHTALSSPLAYKCVGTLETYDVSKLQPERHISSIKYCVMTGFAFFVAQRCHLNLARLLRKVEKNTTPSKWPSIIRGAFSQDSREKSALFSSTFRVLPTIVLSDP